MAAGATYEAIATTTLGSAATSVTFSSIPSTYTDIIIVVSGTTASGTGISLRYNSDTGSNYSDTYVYGNGSSAISGRNTGQNVGYVGYLNTGQGDSIIQVMNYANTTTYKTAIGRGNQAGVLTVARVMLWRSTAAISTITIGTDTAINISSGTTFSLYGIAAA